IIAVHYFSTKDCCQCFNVSISGGLIGRNTYLSVREPAQVVACFICLGHGGFDVLNAYYHGVEIVLGRQLEACIGQRSGKSACHSVGPLSYFSDAFAAVVGSGAWITPRLDAISARRAGAVQRVVVAVSRRICCSRVCKANRYAGMPEVSSESPTRRPGMCRTKRSLVAI